MKINEILIEASEILRQNGVPDAHREAALLLDFTLKKGATFQIAHPEYDLPTREDQSFRTLINRRANREPFHYITGVKEFYGLDFEVSPDVLIPRPETEMLVGKSIEILSDLHEPEFCEIGVGSGCISVSILSRVQAANAVAVDVSEKALTVANQNAKRHGVENRLVLRRSDVFSALRREKFHLIVSNPPYVPAIDLPGLQREVRDFEPRDALTDGGDGLSIVKRILEESPKFLNPGGFMLVEIGFTQAAKVREFFDPKNWNEAEILLDFQGIPRMVLMRSR